jgi:hypothetical protein
MPPFTIVQWLPPQPPFPRGAWAVITFHPVEARGEIHKYFPIPPGGRAGMASDACIAATRLANDLRGPEAL